MAESIDRGEAPGALTTEVIDVMDTLHADAIAAREAQGFIVKPGHVLRYPSPPTTTIEGYDKVLVMPFASDEDRQAAEDAGFLYLRLLAAHGEHNVVPEFATRALADEHNLVPSTDLIVLMVREAPAE